MTDISMPCDNDPESRFEPDPMKTDVFRAFAPAQVKLLPGLARHSFDLNLAYLGRLTDDNLLRAHRFEAGLWACYDGKPENIHWGWDAPMSQLRGQFLGHWMSAAAHVVAATGDGVLKARIDRQVAAIALCQEENGGEWAGTIPEKYLHWIAQGKEVWAPQYVIHKGLMGLIDAYRLAGNEQALDIVVKFARWFARWTSSFSREHMDDILDFETGGMLESWADLYGITGDEEHLALIYKYDRPRLFDRLLAGEDALTNFHANTTIPEVVGAARAWEVTGDPRWRSVVEAYWKSAVTDRGFYCTGGQTCGEIWTPPGEMSARLSDKNQEHCVVYNMMRLSGFLQRWTGDPTFADYYERSFYNGILAQQNRATGMVTYFLPFHAGARKRWGTETNDFWCCHGTLVQAHTLHNSAIYFEDDAGLVVSQQIPSELTWDRHGVEVRVKLTDDPMTEEAHRPMRSAYDLEVSCAEPVEFDLRVRVPWWIAGEAVVTVDGEPAARGAEPSSFLSVKRKWTQARIHVDLPKNLYACPLPDDAETVAFMEGPVVLAGLSEHERILNGDPGKPEEVLTADAEREWKTWLVRYRTRNADPGVRFVPLYEVRDEPYTVYYRVRR
jgi:hypothetical protein